MNPKRKGQSFSEVTTFSVVIIFEPLLPLGCLTSINQGIMHIEV